MGDNKKPFIKHLIKSDNSILNNNENFISLPNNDNKIRFPNMKTLNAISRNFDNDLNEIYKYRLTNKYNKNILLKTDSKYFMNDKKYKLISKKIKKYNSNLNINNYKINKEKKEEDKTDYSTILKYLEKWDKEHCYQNKDKGSISLLYKNLINYYKNNNLINEEKNLNTIDNMLKIKPGFLQFLYNGYFNQNKLLKDLIMRTPSNNNKNKVNNDNKNENENKNNTIHLYNNSNKIKKKNEDVFIKLLNKKKEDKKNNDFYPNKIFKEKIKYEKDLHQKLLFINNLLFNKKFMKEEKKKLLDLIYEEKNKLIVSYNEKFNKDIKQYWLRYDEYDYSYKKRIEILNPNINININKEQLNKRKSLSNKINFFSSHIKNIENLKNNKISSLNTEMIIKQKQLKNEYIEKFKNYNKEKDILENDIKIINNELGYYKHVNDELLREYKTYYMDILKKGEDIRRDGLLWVVKNLIELKINLEYQHFPKYLTHEQIDYLKNLAIIILEENELKIIISILKKRQSNEIINDNIQRMNLVDSLMKDKDNNTNSSFNKKEGNELIKRFYKIYKNNQKALKFNLDKNEEDIKIKNILIQIKKGLYSIGDNLSPKKTNFINDNKISILNAFMGKTKDKDLFNLILSIRNRLIDLNILKNKIIQKEKENYLDSLKFIGNNSYFDKKPIKEIIKKALFGIDQIENEKN